jgi:hypothetical protein
MKPDGFSFKGRPYPLIRNPYPYIKKRASFKSLRGLQENTSLADVEYIKQEGVRSGFLFIR